MCGIAGLIDFDGPPVDTAHLEAMTAVIKHRGPDYSATSVHGNIGLGHVRLSIVDPTPAAHQPFEDDRYSLVYNGEIYNHLELRADLEPLVKKWRSTSDTEVLFFALANWGIEKTLKKTRGMFAFAWVDRKQKTVVLARDRVGIKPLFYRLENKKLSFASEIKAFRVGGDLIPDPVKLLYATVGILEKSRSGTAFSNLFHVEPGGYVTWDGHSLTTASWYRPIERFRIDEYRRLANGRPDDVQAEGNDILKRSVRRMLMGDAPMGVFVSGGIDSSLLATLAHKELHSIRLFTANVMGPLSEVNDARLLAETIGATLDEHPHKHSDFVTDWVKATWFYESPIVVHASAIPMAGVAGTARSAGVKAVLTGEGADELFLGYPRLLTKRFDRLVRFPSALARRFTRTVPPLSRYLNSGFSDVSSVFERSVQGFTRQMLREEGMEVLSSVPAASRNEMYFSYQMINEGILSLLWRNDRMAMRHGIEARFPFLDEDVIDFALNLPVKYKIGRTLRWHNYKHPFLVDKALIRTAAKQWLPSELVTKPKNGFPVAGLRDVKIEKEFFRDGFVAELLSMNRSQMDFLQKEAGSYEVARFASLELFGRLFVRNESIEMVEEAVRLNASMKG